MKKFLGKMEKKRKRSPLSKGHYKEICLYKKNHPSLTHIQIANTISEKYSELNIDRSTVSKVLKKSDEYLIINDESEEAKIKKKKNIIFTTL